MYGLGFKGLGLTLRLRRRVLGFWGRVSALGVRVWDLTTRVPEASGRLRGARPIYWL